MLREPRVRATAPVRFRLLTAVALALLLLAGAGYSRAARAVEAATVAVSPAASSVAVGQELAVGVQVSGAGVLRGIDVVVRYNPEFIQGVKLERGDLLAGKQGFPGAESIDNQGGVARFAFAAFEGQEFATDPGGEALRLVFRGVKEGTSTLAIDYLDLVDATASAGLVPATTRGTVVTVTAVSSQQGDGPDSQETPGPGPGGSEGGDVSGPAGSSPSGQGDTGSGVPPSAEGNNSGVAGDGGQSQRPAAADRGNGPGPDGSGSAGEGQPTTGAAGRRPAPLAALRFKDLEAGRPGAWARDAVTLLTERGVVQGYEDGTFRPEKQVSREEFVVMLVRLLGLPGGAAGGGFADGQTIAPWAREAVTAAAAAGLVYGDDGRFRPADPITRAEIAAILVRALEKQGLSLAQPAGEPRGLPFRDADSVPWARAALAAAFRSGLLSGYEDNSLRPAGEASRAETAAMLSRVLDRLE